MVVENFPLTDSHGLIGSVNGVRTQEELEAFVVELCERYESRVTGRLNLRDRELASIEDVLMGDLGGVTDPVSETDDGYDSGTSSSGNMWY